MRRSVFVAHLLSKSMERGVMEMRTHAFKALTAAGVPVVLGMVLVCAAARGAAQTSPSTTVAALHQPAADEAVKGAAKPGDTKAANTAEADVPPAVARQLAAMQAEIEELKAELKSRDAVVVATPAPAPTAPPAPAVAAVTPAAAPANQPAAVVAATAPATAPAGAMIQAANENTAAGP